MPTHHPIQCLRWGRSVYEKEEDLQKETLELAQIGIEVIQDNREEPSFENIEILVVHSKKKVTQKIFARAKQLKLVITTTSGYDHIDLEAAQKYQVLVARSPLARRDAVIETTLGMGLSLLRDLPYFQTHAQHGDWARAKLPNRTMPLLSKIQIGIIGYGVIGQKAAEIWRSLGAKVRYTDPQHAHSIALEELAQTSQILTLHCALNTTTNNMIDHDILQKMPKGAILLNTARGACVDIDALLQTTHLGGVGLDVFPTEPYPQLKQLSERPNFWVSPHAAGYHEQLGASITKEVVTTIRAWRNNQPLPHPVSL